MFVVSKALSEPDTIAVPVSSVEGVACAFKGCSGFYHPAGGSTGVVLCSPWGFEDLTMRKSWRLLAEAVAQAGFPCLRFDYPGTGDSLGRTTDVLDVADWVGSIGHAADFLRMASGARRFIFIGQSIGATLAAEAARHRSDLVGLQLIAPIVKGRSYVRELAATATIVADRIGIEVDLAPDEGLSVLGFSMSHTLVESLKALDLTKIDALRVAKVTVFDQADRKAGAETLEHLRRLGSIATLETIPPFHVMVSDATVIQQLPVAIDALITNLAAMAPPTKPGPVFPLPTAPNALVTDTFREEPLRFGPNGSLFGVLCRPVREARGAPAVILLNRGLNPHIGWRRVSVDQARGLAAAGITSLRIDAAGLGESRDAADRPPNLIYSDLLLPDIRAAVDVFATRGYERIAVAGVCSGAYMALSAAHADPRITDVFAVNTQRFVWNPAETYEEVIRYGLRSMNDYVGDIRSGNALNKLITRRHRIVPATRFLVKRSVKNAIARVPLRWRSLLSRTSMSGRVHRFFETLAVQDTQVSLVYSAGDPGLMELRNYFGPDGRDLRYANVSVTIVPDADHNLTTTRASSFMLDHMIAFGRSTTAREEFRERARRSFGPRRAVCPT